MSWLKNSGRSEDRQFFKNVKEEPRSFGEFNWTDISSSMEEEAYNRGSGQNPSPQLFVH